MADCVVIDRLEQIPAHANQIVTSVKAFKIKGLRRHCTLPNVLTISCLMIKEKGEC